MKTKLLILFALGLSQLLKAQVVWINEIDYDQISTDNEEFIEIGGTTGTDLSSYKLILITGTTAIAIYDEIPLTGTLVGLDSVSLKTFYFSTNSLQNGDNDGIALVKDDSVVIEFLSYEGEIIDFKLFENSDSLYSSIDLGVEDSNTKDGSLQLTGSAVFPPFTWVFEDITPDLFGVGQLNLVVTGIDDENLEEAVNFNIVNNKILFDTDVEAKLYSITGNLIFSGVSNQITIAHSGIYILNYANNSNSKVERVKIFID